MKLAINPNTISRAYKDLEQEGFLYTVTGKGTFINQEYDLNDSRKEELWQQFDKAAKGLLELAVTKEEFEKRIATLYGVNTTDMGEKKGGSIDDSGK